MEFSELIQKRYSVRAYRPDSVDEAVLTRVLEAGRLAPTAANRQPFRIIVIRTADRQQELRRLYPRDWFSQAPIVLCVCGVASEAWKRRDGRSFLDVDVAIVMDHLVLAAADQGLGTCWVANFDLPTARAILQLPEDVEPIAFAPLGYPADQPSPKTRRPLAELVRYDHW